MGVGKGQEGGQKKERTAEQQGDKGEQKTGDGLPPPRNFVTPHAPREVLARQLQKEEERAAALREEGAAERKIQKAEKKRQRIEDQLKSAGGRTAQSLGLQIRKEEENKRRAVAGMEKCSEEIQTLEEQVAELRKRIEGEADKKERHRQRGEAAEARLAWLATQKAKESMPEPFMARLQTAARAVAGLDLKELGPLKEFLLVFAADPETIDIAGSDTSESSERTEEIMGRSNWEAESDLEAFEAEGREEVHQARRRLSGLHQDYEQAMELAFQQRPRAAKRGWDDEEKKQDEGMGSDEVPTLDPEQTAEFYRKKVVEGAKELAKLEQGARKEIIPVPQRAEGKGNRVAGEQRGAIQKQESGSKGSGALQEQGQPASERPRRRWADDEQQLARVERSSTEVDVSKQQKDEGTQGGELDKEIEEARHQTKVNMEIMLQERLQVQQEQELVAVAKMAVVRRQAEEIEKRRTRPY